MHPVTISLLSLFFLQVHAFTSFFVLFVLPPLLSALLGALSDIGIQHPDR